MQRGAEPRPFRQRLRTDHSFYLELSICDDYGIRHSEFLGWDPDDRAKAIALRMEKAQRCQMCGTAPWEWEQDRYAYEPTVNVCRGCEIKESTAETMDRRAGQTVELASTVGREAAQRRLYAERHYERLRRDRAGEH